MNSELDEDAMMEATRESNRKLISIEEAAALLLDEDAMMEATRESNRKFDPISIEEAAPLFGRRVRTLQRWQAKGRMPERRRYGHYLKYSRREIEDLVREMKSRETKYGKR